jgi:hypothetical protein
MRMSQKVYCRSIFIHIWESTTVPTMSYMDFVEYALLFFFLRNGLYTVRVFAMENAWPCHSVCIWMLALLLALIDPRVHI